MNRKVFLNGSFISEDEARVKISDYAFLFGFGIYETMRSYDGTVFRLNRHLARLRRAARQLGFPSLETNLSQAVYQTLETNRLKEARIRVTVSAGSGSLLPDLASCRSPAVLVYATPYQPPLPSFYERGYNLVITSQRRSSFSLLSRLKTTNLITSILAKREAKAGGGDEALLLNEKGNIAEGGTSNFFMVVDGMLKTPGLSSGILPGITRATVLELASKLGIRSIKGNLKINELENAQEAFVTASTIEIMPVSRINGKPVGKGKPGPVTRKLSAAFRELVARECHLTL